MSRLPPLDPDQLTAAQQQVYDAISSGPRGAKHGKLGLVGPFGVWVSAPDIGDAVQNFGGAVRFATTLDEAVKEVAILTVGAHHHAKFEFAAHARLAATAGVSAADIETLRNQATPAFDRDDLTISHRVASQLMTTSRIDPDTYAEGVAAFTADGMVQLVTIIGYYTLVSFTLNAFEIQVTPDMEDPFPGYS